jgi:hypothetical protein
MITKTQRSQLIFAVPTVLLLIPLIAMQFTTEVDWELSDFVIGGVLLFGTAAIINLVLNKVRTQKNRLIICFAVLGSLFLVWAELAVGIFGTSFAGS